MTLSNIFYPSDQEIKITITNADGTVFDLTAADVEIIVCLYQGKDKQIQEFKKTNSEIGLADAATGILYVKLDRNNSEDCIDGVLMAELELQITDSDYADSIKKIRIGQIDIANMIRSII